MKSTERENHRKNPRYSPSTFRNLIDYIDNKDLQQISSRWKTRIRREKHAVKGDLSEEKGSVWAAMLVNLFMSITQAMRTHSADNYFGCQVASHLDNFTERILDVENGSEKW